MTHNEVVHHVCLAVDDIRAAVAQALLAGATLKECLACGITGPHEHSEGWVAVLAGDSVPGMELEFMQVYKKDEVPERFRVGQREL